MESPHVLLVGRGAQEFAREQGIPQCSFGDLLTERQYKRWKEAQSAGVETEEEPRYHRREVNRGSPREERHGTVGAVAVDTSGILAAATSTGGIFNQYPGRVGDTPHRSEEHTSELQSHLKLVCRLLLEKKKKAATARSSRRKQRYAIAGHLCPQCRESCRRKWSTRRDGGMSSARGSSCRLPVRCNAGSR